MFSRPSSKGGLDASVHHGASPLRVAAEARIGRDPDSGKTLKRRLSDELAAGVIQTEELRPNGPAQ